MAVKKYLMVNSNGQMQEETSVNSSAGAGDEGKVVALNASGKIDSTMLDTTGTENFTASEAISAGSLISIFDDTGTVKIRNADASSSAKPADGYSPSAIESGASGAIVLGKGKISGLTGLTKGARYFLSATPGGITVTAPTTTNYIIQPVGVASSETELEFLSGDFIIRA